MKLKYIIILIILFPILSGCLKEDKEVDWAGYNDLEMNISIQNHINDNDLNCSQIRLNISLKNIGDTCVYVPELLLFDLNIDGLIVSIDDETYF